MGLLSACCPKSTSERSHLLGVGPLGGHGVILQTSVRGVFNLRNISSMSDAVCFLTMLRRGVGRSKIGGAVKDLLALSGQSMLREDSLRDVSLVCMGLWRVISSTEYTTWSLELF